jgi:hypothetical protein
MYISLDPAKRRTPQTTKIISDYAERGDCDKRYATGTARVPFAVGSGVRTLSVSRRSFNKDFLLALAADFKKHGAAAIEKVRKQQPAVYVKICALLVPREMQIEHSGGVKAMSDEQLEQAIQLLREAIAKRDAAANAKVVEGGPRAALPAPRAPQDIIGRPGATREADRGEGGP